MLTNIFPATEHDIYLVSVWNKAAGEQLREAFQTGKKVERVESSFSDPGEDYVKFLADGKELFTWKGY